jgi:hypothetical protein
MQNREELRKKLQDRSKTTTCHESGTNYYFRKGGKNSVLIKIWIPGFQAKIISFFSYLR